MPIRLATAILLSLSVIPGTAGAQSTAENAGNTDRPDRFAPDLDADRLTCRMERDRPSTLVFAHARRAARFGVSSTPTFVFVPRGAREPEDVELRADSGASRTAKER